MDLTEDCWGHVNVCVEGKCGGVRSDIWPEEKSEKLCQHLKCGTSIKTIEIPNGKSEVIVESLHTILPRASLNQSILVLSRIEPKSYRPSYRSAYVVCSGNESMRTSCCLCLFIYSLDFGNRYIRLFREKNRM